MGKHNKHGHADVTWDEQGRPIATAYGDVYFNQENGLEESRYVFLQANNLQERFSQLPEYAQFYIAETGFGTGLNFLVAWQLWQQYAPTSATLHFISVEKYPLLPEHLAKVHKLWPELSELSQELQEYYPYPFSQSVVRIPLLQGRIQLTLLIADAADAFSLILPSLRDTTLHDAHFGEQKLSIDAWFLDGFAPSKNPDIWTAALFIAMAALSKKATTVATFTSASSVKRDLQKAGFNVHKVTGFGKKREMITARLNASQKINYTAHQAAIDSGKSEATPKELAAEHASAKNKSAYTGKPPTKKTSQAKKQTTPWHLIKNTYDIDETAIAKQTELKIAVVGGGLAGSHTAFALAQKGYSVDLFEAGAELGSGASGNPQGVVYTRFSHQQDALAQFNLAALHYAHAFYRTQGIYESCGDDTGVIHQAESPHDEKKYAKIIANLAPGTQYLQPYQQQNSLTASKTALKTDLKKGSKTALRTTKGGWLRPADVCKALTAHANINVYTHCKIEALDYQNKKWQLRTSSNEQRSYTQVVLANAYAVNTLLPEKSFAVKKIRGQLSWVKIENSDTQKAFDNTLTAPLCGQSYVAPACHLDNNFTNNHDQGSDYENSISKGSTHTGSAHKSPAHKSSAHEKLAHKKTAHKNLVFGATFDLKSMSEQISDADNASNVAALQTLLSTQNANLEGIDLNTINARVSFRCTTPDYFPIAGAAPTHLNLQNFSELRRNRYADIHNRADVFPGLYVNVGHGSRGLAYTPICSALIASLIDGDPLPLSENLYQHLHPMRFMIRRLIRNED